MDRAFVNRTIRALYGSMEEFDQFIREVVAPQLIKQCESPWNESWLMIQIFSPWLYVSYFYEMPNIVADKRLSVWSVLGQSVGK